YLRRLGRERHRPGREDDDHQSGRRGWTRSVHDHPPELEHGGTFAALYAASFLRSGCSRTDCLLTPQGKRCQDFSGPPSSHSRFPAAGFHPAHFTPTETFPPLAQEPAEMTRMISVVHYSSL